VLAAPSTGLLRDKLDQLSINDEQGSVSPPGDRYMDVVFGG
jgi:hypothetical protein